MEISFENGKLSYNYIMEYSDISPYDTINETDSDIYDPKGKARHARPFKPAILIE